MIIEQLHKIIESGDYPRLHEVYAADALFDVNVPTWRFKRRGPDEIRGQWAQWTEEGPMRLTAWDERETPWGAVVQMAFAEGAHGEVSSRSLHMLTVVDGRVSEHVMYCTGRWDASTVGRNRVEAPGMAEEA
jgi:SnoaL-like protein